MTKKQQTIFKKLFSDFETIKNFTTKNLSVDEAKAFDDVYSIIDNVYRACTHDTTEKETNVFLSIRQTIKEKYNNSLALWCSGRYLETLEQWYDYILYSHWEDEK